MGLKLIAWVVVMTTRMLTGESLGDTRAAAKVGQGRESEKNLPKLQKLSSLEHTRREEKGE
jgi:hypothetical protein